MFLNMLPDYVLKLYFMNMIWLMLFIKYLDMYLHMHFAVDVYAADKATEYVVEYVTEYVWNMVCMSSDVISCLLVYLMHCMCDDRI